jgi:uncharacterized protein
MSGDFLGTGWAFPIRPDRGGGLAYVSGEPNIEQSLVLLLRTAQGERVMRPRFGTRVRELTFAPGSTRNLNLLATSVREAIRDWEPRVAVEDVNARLDPDDATRALIEITYRIRRSNTRLNLVHPYYLETLEAAP